MKTGIKLFFAGATLVMIGLAIISTGTDASVQDAQADIASFGFAERSQQRKFYDSLQRLGFEKPRQYNWNGNDVWFSTTVTRDSPDQAVQRIQRVMVEEGVNSRPFAEPASTEPITDANLMDEFAKRAPHSVAMLTGGLVPVERSEDHFVMVGNSTEAQAGNLLQLANAGKDALTDGDMTDLFHRMRYVDGYRTQNGTRLTAVWTVDAFQPEKVLNEGEDLNVDTEIPICPGCDRLDRMASDTDGHDTTIVDAGYRRPQSVHRFYHQALTNRGWQTAESSTLLEGRRKLKRQGDQLLASYARGEEMLTLTVFRNDERQTIATLTRAD